MHILWPDSEISHQVPRVPLKQGSLRNRNSLSHLHKEEFSSADTYVTDIIRILKFETSFTYILFVMTRKGK